MSYAEFLVRKFRSVAPAGIAAYAEKPPVERFLAFVAVIHAGRHAGADWTLYERLKRDFVRQCPDATPDEYERVMRAVARAAGV